MAWVDYGFYGEDMALAPIDPTLYAVISAIKERLDAIGVSDSHYNNIANGYYNFWPDANGNTTARRASRYTNIEAMINSAVVGGSNGNFITTKTAGVMSSLYDASVYVDNLLDESVAILADKGFATTKIPVNLSQQLLIQDKNWIIQRKTLIDILRYYAKPTTYNWKSASACLCFQYKRTPRSGGNPDYQPTLSDVFSNLSSVIFTDAPWSGYFDIPLVHAKQESGYGYYSDYILDSIWIEKTFVDNAITATGDADIRLDFTAYNDALVLFDGNHLFQNIDTSAAVNFPSYGDYYKVNFPYSLNDLANMVINNPTGMDTIAGLQENMKARNYLCRVFDGANSFQFLDT